MKKIPTLLKRDPDDRSKVLNEVNPICQWVLDGEGVPTRKYDGTCVKKDETGMWWARREVKPGKSEPEGFVLEDFDEVTGKKQGWILIDESPFHKFWQEALQDGPFEPGTYELVGPKINGNPEGLDIHELFSHNLAQTVPEFRWRYGQTHTVSEAVDLVDYHAAVGGWEGIVWHHPDGRMAKLKARDLK